MSILNTFRRSAVTGYTAITVLAALFALGSSFASTVLVLCDSAHAGVQVTVPHRSHCCGTDTPEPATEHGGIGLETGCPPCNDAAVTVDQHHVVRTDRLRPIPETYTHLASYAVMRTCGSTTFTATHTLPPGGSYVPLCTVIRT